MGMQDLSKALALVKEHPDLAHFVGPRDGQVVAAAEAALGLIFPPTYRTFVQTLGAGSFRGREFYGVVDADFEHSGVPDAIWYTLAERRDSSLPPEMIVVYSLGDGTLFVIDTAHVNEKGEGPMVAWLPGDSQAGATLEAVAPDFGAFLLDRINAALEWVSRHPAQ